MRKLLKTSIWAIFWQIWGQISPNWKSFWKIGFIQIECYIYIVLTSGQKPKNSLELFLKKYQVSDFGLIWRPFCKYLQIKNFFKKSGPVVLPTNQPTNQPTITNNTSLIGPGWRRSNQTFEKIKKNPERSFYTSAPKIMIIWRYHHFTHLHQKIGSNDVWLLRCCATDGQTDRGMDRCKKWNKEVWVSHLKIVIAVQRKLTRKKINK